MSDFTIPEIESERLLLRAIAPDDLDEWIRVKFGDPEVMRHMPPMDVTPQVRARKALEFFSQVWAEHGYGGWLVTDKATGNILGDCYLEPVDDSAADEIEMGVALGRANWRQGVASEAAIAMLRFAFEQVGAKRVFARALADNVASWRGMGRLGFSLVEQTSQHGAKTVVYVMNRWQFEPEDAYYRLRLPGKN